MCCGEGSLVYLLNKGNKMNVKVDQRHGLEVDRQAGTLLTDTFLTRYCHVVSCRLMCT